MIADEAKPEGARRSGDYLQFEELLVEAARGRMRRGCTPAAADRTSGSTNDRMAQRDALLEVFGALTGGACRSS